MHETRSIVNRKRRKIRKKTEMTADAAIHRYKSRMRDNHSRERVMASYCLSYHVSTDTDTSL